MIKLVANLQNNNASSWQFICISITFVIVTLLCLNTPSPAPFFCLLYLFSLLPRVQSWAFRSNVDSFISILPSHWSSKNRWVEVSGRFNAEGVRGYRSVEVCQMLQSHPPAWVRHTDRRKQTSSGFSSGSGLNVKWAARDEVGGGGEALRKSQSNTRFYLNAQNKTLHQEICPDASLPFTHG